MNIAVHERSAPEILHPKELRDEFAVAALSIVYPLVQSTREDIRNWITAGMAYDLADAMLKARKR